MARRGSRAKKKKTKRLARKKRLRRIARSEQAENTSSVASEQSDPRLTFIFCRWRCLAKQTKDETGQDDEKNPAACATSAVPESSSPTNIPAKNEKDDSAAADMDSKTEPGTTQCECSAPTPLAVETANDIAEIPQETVASGVPPIDTPDIEAQEIAFGSIPTRHVGEPTEFTDFPQYIQGGGVQPETVSSEMVSQPTPSSSFALSSHAQEDTLESISTESLEYPPPPPDSPTPSPRDGAPLEPMRTGPVGESMPVDDSTSSTGTHVQIPPEVPSIRSLYRRLSKLEDIIGFNTREVGEVLGGLGGPRDEDDNRLTIMLLEVFVEVSRLKSTIKKHRAAAGERRPVLARLVGTLENWVRGCERGLQEMWMEMEELTMEEHLIQEVRMSYQEWAHSMWEGGVFLKSSIAGCKMQILQLDAGMNLELIEEQPEAENIESQG